MIDREAASFAHRYGPWALVAGASEGVGAAFARGLAERDINVVLLARRQDVLDGVADAIRTETGVEVRAVAVDLTDGDAMASITAATDDIEVGLLMYCAGADPNYRPFLAEPLESALAMVQRNCVMPMQLCHRFAAPMAERGRGGIVLVSSGGGLIGAPNMVAYGASKAFDMVMAEALWAELHDQGVDVLGLVLGMTDTPALRRLMVRRGQLAHPDDPVPGATPPRRSPPRRSPTSRRADLVGRRRRADGLRAPRCDATERRRAPDDRRRRRVDGKRSSRGGDVMTGPLDGAARQEIAEVQVRYATGIDRRDWELFRTCFTDDCVADYGDIGVWHGADEITAWMDQAHLGAGHTLHRITNHSVLPDGDGARARCYVDAIVLGADNLTGVRAVGFYDDELIRTEHGWQIHRRRFTSVFVQGIGPSSTRSSRSSRWAITHRAVGESPHCPTTQRAPGWNSSTTLPEGSSRRICFPPGPVTMSLRNDAPRSRSSATSASMSSTWRWMRFQPPGPGVRPSGIGRPAELVGPLSSSRRLPRRTSAKAGAEFESTLKPSCRV